MGNVIPWSQIHPSIKSDVPFVGVIIIDPDRRLCVSETVSLDVDGLHSPEVAASETIAAAQQAAARVAASYKDLRKQPAPGRRRRPISNGCARLEAEFGPGPQTQPSLRVLRGGVRDRSASDGRDRSR